MRRPRAQRLLVFLDQAEAIFLLPPEERDSFLTLLDRIRRVDRCVVVLAMRADFFSDLMSSVLWPISGGERVEIAPLRGDRAARGDHQARGRRRRPPRAGARRAAAARRRGGTGRAAPGPGDDEAAVGTQDPPPADRLGL